MVVIAIPASKLGPIGRPIIPAFVNINSHVVIAGLDPAIHPFAKTLAKKMDARVKPGHDGSDFLIHSNRIGSYLPRIEAAMARASRVGHWLVSTAWRNSSRC